jgi:hypothetical protein
MRSKPLHEKGGKRTFAVVLDTGDETLRCLLMQRLQPIEDGVLQ